MESSEEGILKRQRKCLAILHCRPLNTGGPVPRVVTHESQVLLILFLKRLTFSLYVCVCGYMCLGVPTDTKKMLSLTLNL